MAPSAGPCRSRAQRGEKGPRKQEIATGSPVFKNTALPAVQDCEVTTHLPLDSPKAGFCGRTGLSWAVLLLHVMLNYVSWAACPSCLLSWLTVGAGHCWELS